MMDLPTLKTLIETMAALDLDDLRVERDGWTLQLQRRPSAVVPAAPRSIAAAAPGPEVRAPLSGVLHLRPSPGATPFVCPGQAVRAGDTLCIIEAMKVFNHVRAQRDGCVAAMPIADGTEIEAGQTLMRLE